MERGYRVVDEAAGSRLERLEAPKGPAADTPVRLRPQDVASVLGQPTVADISVQWIVEGWPHDVVRGIESFRRFDGGRRVQHVVADVAGIDPDGMPEEVEVLLLTLGTGFAAARNAGLRRARGRTVLLVDGSVEATGDLFAPLERALADPQVGLAGPFGIVTGDLHEFESSPGVGTRRAVDAIEGYLIALRRDLLTSVGMLDEHFRFYRSCDIEYSFRVKDAGFDTVVVDLPLHRTRAPRVGGDERTRPGADVQAQLLPIPGPLPQPFRSDPAGNAARRVNALAFSHDDVRSAPGSVGSGG